MGIVYKTRMVVSNAIDVGEDTALAPVLEGFFNKIKHFRRIATRYVKTETSFFSMLSLVGAMIWLR